MDRLIRTVRWLAAAAALALCASAAVVLAWHSGHHRIAITRTWHPCLERARRFYVGIAVSKPTVQTLAGFSRAAGAVPSAVEFYQNLRQPLDLDAVKRIAAGGALPLIILEPRRASLPQVMAGRYDRLLRQDGREIAATGCQVAISFAHEPNGTWYPWGYTHVPPAFYVAAWRHVHDVIKATGARVTWVWAVNRTGSHETSAIAPWWPGARYVDWVGVDAYYRHRSQTFAAVFGALLGAVHQLTSKPVLITETAIGPGLARAGRMSALFLAARLTGLRGVLWFDVNAKQRWRVNDDHAAMAIFRAQLNY